MSSQVSGEITQQFPNLNDYACHFVKALLCYDFIQIWNMLSKYRAFDLRNNT